MRRTICHIGNGGATFEHTENTTVVGIVKLFFQRLLKFTSSVLEHGLGMCIGALLGWIVGWYAGRLYVAYFEPVYLSDFSGLNDIMCWEKLPRIFAAAGVFAGVVIGVTATFCLSRKTSGNKNDVNEYPERNLC